MKRRHKLVKSHISDSEKGELINVEQLNYDRHIHEKLHDEEIAVYQTKSDPKKRAYSRIRWLMSYDVPHC